MQKLTSSSVRRERRTTEKKRRRIPKKYHRATTNLTEGTKISKKHARKRSRSTRRVQKRVQQGHAIRRQGAWPDIRTEQQTILRKKRKRKIRKRIAGRWRQNLSGEFAAGKKKAQRWHARKGRWTWTGMQRDYQTNHKRKKKKNTRWGIENSRQGTLSGKIKAGQKKMSRRRPQARWGFTEEG